MTITFFSSILCPRCHYTNMILRKLSQHHPDLIIKKIDVTLHPLAAWQRGIKIIPALQIESDILAGIFLNETAINKFLLAHGLV